MWRRCKRKATPNPPFNLFPNYYLIIFPDMSPCGQPKKKNVQSHLLLTHLRKVSCVSSCNSEFTGLMGHFQKEKKKKTLEVWLFIRNLTYQFPTCSTCFMFWGQETVCLFVCCHLQKWKTKWGSADLIAYLWTVRQVLKLLGHYVSQHIKVFYIFF